MCGIMGYIGKREAWPIVMTGLKRLEYRGYDSAGVGTIYKNRLRVAKQVGHLSALDRSYPEGLPGNVAIGHTRWATHGGITQENCHPHVDPGRLVAVVHNGIIDNAEEIKEALQKEGASFRSETDTEVLAHLIARELEEGRASSLVEAVRAALLRIHGTAGILVLSRLEPEVIVAARIGSPVVLGISDEETFIASDPSALVGHTTRIVFLDDSEVAEITARGFRTIDLQNRLREKRVEQIEFAPDEIALQGYRHYMLKEIAEQPAAIDRTLRGRTDMTSGTARLGGLKELGRRIFDFGRITLFGCGTSLHAAGVGQFLMERYARIPAGAEDAAELRSRNPIVSQDNLYVAISQSGETADVLSTLREIKMRGGMVAGITNMVGSSIARETDCGVYIHAGPEISVASTKAFTSQVTALSLMALLFARMRDLPAHEGREWVGGLNDASNEVHAMLVHRDRIKALAEEYCRSQYVMFVGRGISYPVAREGALKLKEIAYIPCDGLSGADMKHGPLSLIEQDSPVWAIVPPDETRERMVGNLQELKARGAAILAVAAPEDEEVARLAQFVIPLPPHHPACSPLLTVVPLQLFAYYAAVALGRNIDKPRNLAKSVTVE
ncbi:MAG: glutamine--fructose-6-phosphate transaminase (isomerizing) [Bradymonadales bacterium]|nr:glutamine--fructose-6-phosphate transaminase (isomerizing) [Bradymonadales bacterium]